MTKTMNYPKEYLRPTETWSAGDVASKPKIGTSTKPSEVYQFAEFVGKAPNKPDGFIAIGELIDKYEKHENRREALSNARRWLAAVVQEEDRETIRTLRLKKGWSQSRLATEINTSQPHIARIECGKANLFLNTCRKLCNAFDIDMNTLDRALKNTQEIDGRG